MLRRLLRQFRMGKKAKDVEPVVHRDGYDAFARHVRAVITGLRAIPILKATAENIHKNGQPLPVRFGRGPDIEIQAVLAHAIAAKPIVGGWRGSLHAARAELTRAAHARPVLHRLWCPPAQIAYGRQRKWDSFKTPDWGTRLADS